MSHYQACVAQQCQSGRLDNVIGIDGECAKIAVVDVSDCSAQLIANPSTTDKLSKNKSVVRFGNYAKITLAPRSPFSPIMSNQKTRCVQIKRFATAKQQRRTKALPDGEEPLVCRPR
ncbi:hypothetical protein ACO2I3_09500 [Leptospira interrogans]